MTSMLLSSLVLLLVLSSSTIKGLDHINNNAKKVITRRAILSIAGSSIALLSFDRQQSTANAAVSNGLPLTVSSSGLKWADARIGKSDQQPLSIGQTCSIDYSIASTAGRFPQIYSTKDTGAPYRWTLGDGSTIQGIEMSILGTNDIPPMLPGGIRRVIVPASLGYDQLRTAKSNKVCVSGVEGSINPIPPKDQDYEAYQRWYSFYCNPRIPYQPDLVLDIKLYGKR